MKCWRCDAQNPRDASSCWACGVSLSRDSSHKAVEFRPEAMRHYSTAATTMQHHRTWLDGVVLVSTVLFGLVLGLFVSNVLPESIAGERASARSGPFGWFSPAPTVLPVQPVGHAVNVNGVVAQVAEVRRAPAEAAREAGDGNVFLTATVVIDNQAQQPFTYSLADWKARDSRGRTYPAVAISSPGWLSSGRVTTGQPVLGAVTFAIPATEAEGEITFSPAAFGAVARWSATP